MVEGVFYAKAAAYIGAAIVMGVGSIGPALGQGLVGTKACESVGKNPENTSKIQATMGAALVFIETSSIYCFIIALLLVLTV